MAGTAGCEEARGGEQGFRGYAAKVQAITAHQTALDQYDLGTHLSRAGGDRQATRAGPDNAEIGSKPQGHAVFLSRHRL